MGKRLGACIGTGVLALLTSGGATLMGCKHAVEWYCDEDTPCLPRYPDRPYCDLAGDYPASEGIGRTCIPCPFEGAPSEMCGSIADAGIPDANTEAPQVISTTPLADETGVEPTVVVQATFSEDVNPDTVDETSFLIAHEGNPVVGTVTYEVSTRTASFTTQSRLSLLGSFQAAITTAVTDLGGMPLAAEHQWSFAVRDGIWGSAQLIETDDTRDAIDPQIAVVDTGNAIAAWGQTMATQEDTWANSYDPGSGWGSAVRLEVVADAANDVQVGVDASGNAIAVWRQSNRIMANRYQAGAGWGGAVPIDGDVGNPSAPAVAVHASGSAISVWSQSDGTRNNIWANRYVAGIGWDVAELIETDNAGGAGGAQVAVDASGNAIAIWSQSDGTRLNIWANRYVAGSGWGSAGLIETTNSGPAQEPQIAVDASGNAIAVWSQSDGTRDNIWANAYVLGSGWGTATVIENNAGAATDPQVAVDVSGNAIAVWSQSDGTRFNIWAQRYVNGSGWSTATLLETDDAAGAVLPAVALDSRGNATAAWQQSDGTRNNIWANRYVVGTGWLGPVLVENSNLGGANHPQLAADAAGNMVIVWSQYDGTMDSIWANSFR